MMTGKRVPQTFTRRYTQDEVDAILCKELCANIGHEGDTSSSARSPDEGSNLGGRIVTLTIRLAAK